MGERVRMHDWAGSDLGSPAGWPQSLRSAVGICLESGFQIAIYWGPALILIYNDLWSEILGFKHPASLGKPASEVWPEIWDTIGPLFENVVSTGDATRSKDQLLAMRRRGFTEECYFDYTFSPIREESGTVGGIFNIVVETTSRVLRSRRQQLLGELRAATAGARTPEEVCSMACGALRTDPYDLPFALLYLSANTRNPEAQLVLAATVGLPLNSPAAPAVLETLFPQTEKRAAETGSWPTAGILKRKDSLVVPHLGDLFEALPGGPWPEVCNRALLVPIPGFGEPGCSGVLIVGLSPRLELDSEYQTFLERTAGVLAAEIANARVAEQDSQRLEALAELDRAKITFFSNVSHEFRTPLTLLLGPIEDALYRENALTESGRQQLLLAHRNALRLQKLVNTLLDFSRIEAGRTTAAYEPTDLAAYTADLASNFRSICGKVGLSFDVECELLTEPVFVDREMWEKIVLNLISNAFKFTLAGGIRISVKEAGQTAQLQVSDTGSGIAASELPHLFQRFHRIEGARGRSMEGSGIGLALVRELVGLHGGTIGVESSSGAGSIFTVTIPLGTAHLPPDRITTSATPATAFRAEVFTSEAMRWLDVAAPDDALPDETANEQLQPEFVDGETVQRPRVLLADDNADMRSYIAGILNQRFEVTAAADGEAALREALLHPPDLILTDVMMPILDGFELLRAVRADARLRDIPVILLSARAGEESRVEGLSAGADDYLVKPFNRRELLARVSSRLEIAAVRKQSLETLRCNEAALKESQKAMSATIAEFEALFQELPVGVAVAYDIDCRQIRVNSALANLLGIREEDNASVERPDAEPLPFRVMRDGRELQPDDLPMQMAVKQNRPVRGFEMDIVGPNGDIRHEYVNAVPLLNHQGNVRGGLGVFLDITERKRAEEALRRSEAELRKTTKELELFAYPAGHDLQEPLRTVLLFSELFTLEYDDKLDARGRHLIACCREGAKRMEVLIRDLLNYAQASSAPEDDPVPIDLNEVVGAALKGLRGSMVEKGAEVVVGDLPTVPIDQKRFQQLFQNLIANSLKYSKDSESPRIEISARKVDDSWMIGVTDNGIGIDPRHHADVFTAFKRIHNPEQSGTGLGLAICQKIVERHGGRIWVESEPMRGATVFFTLPRQLAQIATA